MNKKHNINQWIKKIIPKDSIIHSWRYITLKIQYLIPATLLSFVLISPVLLTGCASTPKQESTGQFIDSSALTLKVKSKFLTDKSIKSLPITVNTYNNVVQLSGFVDNQQQKNRAVFLARHVKGVASVRDNLLIK